MGLLDNRKYPLRDESLNGIIGLPVQYQYDQYQSQPMSDLFGYPDYGRRYDNSAPKGLGFFGLLNHPNQAPYQQSVSTELSVGVPLAGKEREIPSLVPTLVPQEIDWLLNGGEMTGEILNKAYAHALMRYKQGLSPFAD